MKRIFSRLRSQIPYIRTAKSFLRCRFFGGRPFMLSHLITNRCNATCLFCPWRFPAGDELTTSEIRNLYRQASDFGFTLNFIWGGEPLLREDLTEVVQFSKGCGLSTSVFTNGYLLGQHHEFARHCDALILSLDAADESHDAVRGTKNLFMNAIKGIELVKIRYPEVEIFINCLLSRLNPGKISGIMELAREMGITVFFSPVLYDDRFPCGEISIKIPDLRKPLDALREDFLLIKGYKRRGYPVNNSCFSMNYFIQKQASYRCYWPHICLTVYPEGSLEDCTTRTFFANFRRQPLREIVNSPSFRELQSKTRRCSLACQNLDSIEASGVWELQWDSLRNYHEVFRSKGGG